ncbi:MAG: long-chain fatty acid--CoA ligase [Chitinophagaceae bacterium]
MTQRLFDFVKERYDSAPTATLLAAKENGQWREYLVSEVWEAACAMANGLQQLGVQNEDLSPETQEKIAIISPNRPEWIITDLAVQLCGAVLTPIYPTIAPHELAFVLRDAGVKKLIIADEKLYNNFKEALKDVPELTDIFSFDKISEIRSWKDLHSGNKKPNDALLARIKNETLATIIYTSGTTGNPKGVMLSHSNIVSNVQDSMPAFTFAKVGERALSFLPLNHIFERMVTYIYINAGLSIWYAESMDSIGANLKEVKPMVFCTVPRLLEKVYEKIMATAIELKGIKRALFFWALKLGKQYDNVNQGSAWYRMQLALANKLIFSKWREALGGNVKAIVTGSAACQERLIRIFTAANVVIMEGYGLTETSPVITVNRFESEGRRVGTIGPLIDHVEVKLAEDGEILCKGPNVMMGYYKQPELTAAAMEDGWFHTGDIGTWVEGKFLKITDRKKEIFKTSGGKYVAPQPIENKMRESIFIEQIMVIGAGRKFVSALIVPSILQLHKALKDAGTAVPEDNAKLVAMPEVQQIVRGQLDKYNVQFNHVEQVKKFTLLPTEWTIDSGELTPSLKAKRKVVEAKFEKEIEAMYE